MKGSLSNLGDCHIIQKLRWWCYKYITVALFLSPGCRFVKSEGEKMHIKRKYLATVQSLFQTLFNSSVYVSL